MQRNAIWSMLAAPLRRRAAEPEDSVTERNIRLFYWDMAWFGFLFGVSANFLIVFVTRLNATPLLISAVTSGPALINILWQLPATRIVERLENPQRQVVRSALPQRLGFL